MASLKDSSSIDSKRENKRFKGGPAVGFWSVVFFETSWFGWDFNQERISHELGRGGTWVRISLALRRTSASELCKQIRRGFLDRRPKERSSEVAFSRWVKRLEPNSVDQSRVESTNSWVDSIKLVKRRQD